MRMCYFDIFYLIFIAHNGCNSVKVLIYGLFRTQLLRLSYPTGIDLIKSRARVTVLNCGSMDRRDFKPIVLRFLFKQISNNQFFSCQHFAVVLPLEIFPDRYTFNKSVSLFGRSATHPRPNWSCWCPCPRLWVNGYTN